MLLLFSKSHLCVTLFFLSLLINFPLVDSFILLISHIILSKKQGDYGTTDVKKTILWFFVRKNYNDLSTYFFIFFRFQPKLLLYIHSLYWTSTKYVHERIVILTLFLSEKTVFCNFVEHLNSIRKKWKIFHG